MPPRTPAPAASAARPSERHSRAQVLTASAHAATDRAWQAFDMRSTRCAPAPPWARRCFAAAVALLALTAPTARGDASAMVSAVGAPAVAVATAAELEAAVDGGVAHIVVTDHLDLSTISTIRSPERLASIRVRTLPHKARFRLVRALLLACTTAAAEAARRC